MRFVFMILLIAATLPACTSTGGEHLDDLKSSMSGGFGKNTDTRGTNRRPDVDYGFTRPSTPTIMNR